MHVMKCNESFSLFCIYLFLIFSIFGLPYAKIICVFTCYTFVCAFYENPPKKFLTEISAKPHNQSVPVVFISQDSHPARDSRSFSVLFDTEMREVTVAT